jgi:uncharacterized protein YacL
MSFTGEQEDQAKDMSFLLQRVPDRHLHRVPHHRGAVQQHQRPMVVLSTVLFSTIGVFLGLVVFRMDFVILMTMLGIISLIGVVVNNAIVLMDFARLLFARSRRKLGLRKRRVLANNEVREALVIAGRPVCARCC